jgi:magnesium transporter
MRPLVMSQVTIPSTLLVKVLRSQTEGFLLAWQPPRLPECRKYSQHVRPPSTCFQYDLKLLPPPRSQPTRQSDIHYNAPRTPTLSDTSHLPRQRRSSFGDAKRFSLRRLFSSSRTSYFWNILGAKKIAAARERALPPLASFLDDSASPGRILKATNEPRIRCTEFDENGNVTLVNGEFKKSELIAKVCATRLRSCAGWLTIKFSMVCFPEIFAK